MLKNTLKACTVYVGVFNGFRWATKVLGAKYQEGHLLEEKEILLWVQV